MGQEVAILTDFSEYSALTNSDRRKLTGQGERFGNFLPKLRINYDSEFIDENAKSNDPIAIPRGS